MTVQQVTLWICFCELGENHSVKMPTQDPVKISKVVVHPLVLLSVVDHFNRMGKVGNIKRVCGVLLGSNRQGVLDVSNSFAGQFTKHVRH